MNNKLLFVIANLRTGGSEIYLINFANWLSNNGFKIDILVLGKIEDQLLKTASDRINIQRIDHKQNMFFKIFCRVLNLIPGPSYLLSLPFVKKNENPNYLNIHCFDTESLILASILFPISKITIGIYQKNEFFWNSSLAYRAHRDQLLARIALTNVYTDKKTLLTEFSCYFKNQQLSKSYNVFPFSVEVPKVTFEKYREDSKLIVVAARHSFTKGFIPFLISNYENLFLKKNYIMRIFGEGTETKKLKNQIPLSYKDKIKFEGNVDLCTLSRAINAAELFIGTGSTCILSATIGTPTIVCSEGSSGERAKGFFHDLKVLHYYPIDQDFHLKNIVKKFISLSNAEKQKISNLTKVSAKKYDKIKHYKNMLAFFKNAKIVNFQKPSLKLLSVLEIFIKHFLYIDRSYKNRINVGSE